MKVFPSAMNSEIIGLWVFLVTTCGLLADPVSDGLLWKDKIERASPGSKVELPAGRFEMADIRVPEGVKLSGAGFLQTVIDSANGTDGLVVAKGCEIRGLTVRQSPGAGVLVKEAADVLISGVRIERCMTGAVILGSAGFRMENSIVFANRTGLAGSFTSAACVVNNTFFNNNSLGLSLISSRNATVFNNIVANSATGIYLSNNTGLRLDYNLYLANYIGKIPGHPGSISVQGWRDLAVQDEHSLQEVIAFTKPEEGLFEPATRLVWSPDRSPAMGFGTALLGTAHAPVSDLTG